MKAANEQIQVCIQVSAGSRERKVYNEKTLELLRVSNSRTPYPYAYGFILDTDSTDGLNLDCYVISAENLASGTVVTCEPVALVDQYEDDEIDHKIIATLPGEGLVFDGAAYQRLRDFIITAFAEFPHIRIGVGPIQSRQAALDCIRASR